MLYTKSSVSGAISPGALVYCPPDAEGEDEIVQKIGEEAVEIILAAKGQGNPRLIEEVADLTYHVLVMLAYRGLSPRHPRGAGAPPPSHRLNLERRMEIIPSSFD